MRPVSRPPRSLFRVTKIPGSLSGTAGGISPWCSLSDPHLRTAELRTRARAWARLRLWPEEMQAWIAAVGVDGAAVARDCRTAGITLAAMGVVLDGMRVKHRLRGGESAFSVLARAAACGRSLNE